MNILLQTACGTCSNTCSSSSSKIFQGTMKVNGASPFLWMIISIILVRCIFLKGLDTPGYAPMSHMMLTLIELMRIDVVDLNMLSTKENLLLK